MGDFFRRYPLATLISWTAGLLTLLVTLQASGILTGQAAAYVNIAAGLLQVILTAYAKSKVTPVANPHDDQGRKLAPVTGGSYR